MSRSPDGHYCRTCGARLAADNHTASCASCDRGVRQLLEAPEMPAGFWSVDLMRDASNSWHIGWVVAAYRNHPFHDRPLSQETVGSWVGMTQPQISKLETGPPEKNLDKLVLWARTLKISEQYLWFSLPDELDSRRRHQREAALPSADDDTIVVTSAGHGHVGGSVEVVPPPAVRTSVGSADPVVEASQRQWRRVRRYLNRHRAALAGIASQLYRTELRLPGTCLLTSSEWMPVEPVDLDDVVLRWQAEPSRTAVDGTEPEAQLVCPLQSARFRFRTYTAAIRYVDPPTLFENRPSYRLLDVGWEAGKGALSFGLATYFDKLDISEAIGHELAMAVENHLGQLEASPQAIWEDLPFRRTIGDLFDLSDRAVVPALTTLTILRQPASGDATFILHWRDPARVATAGGQYDVIPAGEFQPSTVIPWAYTDDLDLWRNIVREYSEELCGTTEHDGSRGVPIDYEGWPFYRAIGRAREAERLRAYCLGVGLDALTLAATIPTVVVVDEDAFAEVFGEVVHLNAEGVTVMSLDGQPHARGIPFTEENVQRFLQHEPMAPPGAACLALAWRHRAKLLGHT